MWNSSSCPPDSTLVNEIPPLFSHLLLYLLNDKTIPIPKFQFLKKNYMPGFFYGPETSSWQDW